MTGFNNCRILPMEAMGAGAIIEAVFDGGGCHGELDGSKGVCL